MLKPQSTTSRTARFAETGMIALVRQVFALARWLGPERAGNVGSALARRVGPLLSAHRTGLRNLRAAFPDKSEAEIGAIIDGAWDNLGRTGAEYAHLDSLVDFDPEATEPGRVEVSGIPHFLALRDDEKPGIIFSAHLGNWELPAIIAAKFGLEATAVYRPPNAPAAALLVYEVRSQTMGALQASHMGAAFAMDGVLARGGHLGMLIDQHFTRGVEVEFMGRPALANPILAKLARHYDCPVHGTRVIRLPGHRFRMELTPPLELPRDGEGLIAVQPAMQVMTRVVEGWVREHPEQWLWMHRRWRVAPALAKPAAKETAR